MYNIYGTSSGQENYGSFKLEYSDPPLNFEPGSKMALLNLMTWNNIYNISAERGNNVIYILDKQLSSTQAYSGATHHLNTEHADWAPIDDKHDTDSVSIALRYTGIADLYEVLFKIILPDGQYSIEALDREIAIRLGVDITQAAGEEITLVGNDDRKFWIEANETYNKVDFHYDSNRFDVVAAEAADPSKNLFRFLGIQDVINTSYQISIPSGASVNGVTRPQGAFDSNLFSLNKYYDSSYNPATTAYYTGDSTYSRIAPKVADVNNGMTSMNLRLRNGIINGGMESNHGGPSDILYSFNITSAPGYPQNDSPPNLVWLDITATNTPINELFFEYTDQNGTPLNHNMADESSFTLVVKGADEDLSAAISNLTAVINNISMGNK